MTIVEFLRARLDEDEQAARAADWDRGGVADWHIQPSRDGEPGLFEIYAGPDPVAGFITDANGIFAEHIARRDPAWVLADVAAKRKIIERYERALTVIGAGNTLASFTRGQDDGYRQGCLDALYDLALPWRP